ncbi:MAG: 4-hydroxy-tetrahydrodipicolinate reductase [bacterium]
MTDADKLSVIVAGVAGRMGQIITKLLENSDSLQFVGGLEKPDSKYAGEQAAEAVEGVDTPAKIFGDINAALKKADVLIDFTRPEATVEFLREAAKLEVPVVTGTTGLNSSQKETVQAVAKEIPVVKAANMSMGINLLLELLKTTTESLGEGFDVEIVEMHHRFKEDAPSGTARMLGESVARARGQEFEEVKKTGREGFVGERTGEEIGISALRGGDVVGEHTVIFAGMGERIEFTHRASSRRTFAAGALRAAEYVANKEKGLYDMRDVLGLG